MMVWVLWVLPLGSSACLINPYSIHDIFKKGFSDGGEEGGVWWEASGYIKANWKKILDWLIFAEKLHMKWKAEKKKSCQMSSSLLLE